MLVGSSRCLEKRSSAKFANVTSRIGFFREERLALRHEAYNASLYNLLSRQVSQSYPASHSSGKSVQVNERLEDTAPSPLQGVGYHLAVRHQIDGLDQARTPGITLNNEIGARSQLGAEATETLGDRIGNLSDLSNGRFKDVLHLLRQIQTNTSSRQDIKTIDPTYRNGLFYSEAPVTQSKPARDDSLMASIGRLCSLNSKNFQSCLDDKALTAIEGLEAILDAVLKTSLHAGFRESTENGNRIDERQSCAKINPDFDTECWYATKRIRGLLSVSQSIETNAAGPKFRRSSASEKPVKSIAKSKSYAVDGCTVSLSFSKRAHAEHKLHEPRRRPCTESISELFEATISILPLGNPHSTKVSVSFVQRATRKGCEIRNSCLQFCSVVSEESAALVSVRTGDLAGLIGLLEAGGASMTDCDSEGRSLLNVNSTCS